MQVEKSAKELAEEVCQEMVDNLRRNVAAFKKRQATQQSEPEYSMNGVCCK